MALEIEGKSEDDNRGLAKSIAAIFTTGRLGQKKAFTSSEDRRILELVQAADGDVDWGKVREKFPRTQGSRFANELRDRARTLSETVAYSLRCAYGFSHGPRCSNTRAVPEITFQTVPKNSKVLSEMAITEADWKESFHCCSDHGQDPAKRLSLTNLPGHASPISGQRITPRTSTTPSNPTRRRDTSVEESGSRTSPSDRHDRENERAKRRLLSEIKLATTENDRQRSTLKETYLVDNGGDKDLTINQLIEELMELRQEKQEHQRQSSADKTRIEEFCPVHWDHIDDEWVKNWTPFHNKASAMAFFEVFVVPRVSRFQSYTNFKNHVSIRNAKTSSSIPVTGIDTLDDGQAEILASFSRKKRKRATASEVKKSIATIARRRLERGAAFRDAAAGGDPKIIDRKTYSRKSRPYTPHSNESVQLNEFQEFVIYLIWIRRGIDKDILAYKFLGVKTLASMRCIRSVICTWVAAMYEILTTENWWLKPEDRSRASSKAFASAPQALAVSDCTAVMCASSQVSEMVSRQLHSKYYGGTCGKYNITCSPIGGTTCVSPGFGGPAGDHKIMEAAGLFDADKWKVPDGHPWAQLFYDAGVSTKTKTAAMNAGIDLVCSGIVRKKKTSLLSYQQRTTNFKHSSMRIRVENFIGIVKKRFKILNTTIATEDIGMMDKIVYACFIFHNFGNPIIK
jgi:hypothetical protein